MWDAIYSDLIYAFFMLPYATNVYELLAILAIGWGILLLLQLHAQ